VTRYARRRAPLILLLTAHLALGGCGSAESRAVDDGKSQLEAKLEDLRDEITTSFAHFDPASDSPTQWLSNSYAGAYQDGVLTIRVGINVTGRDPWSVGETTASTGACFEVSGGRHRARLTQVACPRSFLQRPGDPVDRELLILEKPEIIRIRDSSSVR
jgi:hypothetical protein